MGILDRLAKMMGQSFKLKGSLFTLSVLQLLTADLNAFDQDLKAKIQLAPKFFNCTPMVIDVQALKVDQLDFTQLKQVLQDNQVIAVGIKGAPNHWLEAIREANLAVMNDHVKADKKPGGNAAFTEGTKIISEPVRSGQRIYAEGGDLIVIGTVSSGAEILADGNIHVYGSLRGRALAGVNGNKNTRIFCQQLAAELVSIAGHFQLFEHITELTHSLTEVYLKEDELIIATL